MKKFIVLSIVLLMLAGFAITSSAEVVTLFARIIGVRSSHLTYKNNMLYQ